MEDILNILDILEILVTLGLGYIFLSFMSRLEDRRVEKMSTVEREEYEEFKAEQRYW